MNRPNSRRNVKIIEDRSNGMTYKEISMKYGVTSARVGQICKKDEARKELLGDPLYMRLIDSCWTLGFDPICAIRAYNAITKCYGICKGEVVDCRTVEGLRDALGISGFDVGDVRNIGPRSKKLILHAFGRDSTKGVMNDGDE